MILVANSSTIHMLDYDPASEMLTVEFKTGATWVYRDVPSEMYSALVHAPSVGGYYSSFIKGKKPGQQVKSARPTSPATPDSDLAKALQASIDAVKADTSHVARHEVKRADISALVGFAISDAQWADVCELSGGPVGPFLDWCLDARKPQKAPGSWLVDASVQMKSKRYMPPVLEGLGEPVIAEGTPTGTDAAWSAHHTALKEAATTPHPEELRHLGLTSVVTPTAAELSGIGSAPCPGCSGYIPAGCRICGGLGTVPTRPMDF